MKVFRMNEYDCVCAETEEKAKKFYEQFTDREEINEFFEGEVSLTDKVLYRVSDLKLSEIDDSEERVAWQGEEWVLRTFYWVINRENITEPRIISSTEQ